MNKMNRLNNLMDMVKDECKTKKFVSLHTNINSDNIELESNKNYNYYDPSIIMNLKKQGFYNNYPRSTFSPRSTSNVK